VVRLAGPAGRPLDAGRGTAAPRVYFRRGLGIHLTNPKAILVWMTTITLGLPAGAPPSLAFLIVGGCATLGVLIFSTYALAFSTRPMVLLYARARRRINAAMAVFFGVVGTRLLLSQA
jgi:threonine/homoserine/homoserine lactone efflux protein